MDSETLQHTIREVRGVPKKEGSLFLSSRQAKTPRRPSRDVKFPTEKEILAFFISGPSGTVLRPPVALLTVCSSCSLIFHQGQERTRRETWGLCAARATPHRGRSWAVKES